MMLASLIHLNRLRKQQWLDFEKLEAIQRRKLQVMIGHAYHNVTHYRRLLDEAGLKPEDITSAADLAKIPITTRHQLQNLPPEDITAKNINIDRCKKIKTAGSSGMPLDVYLRHEDSRFYDMVWARTSLENGKKLGDRTAYFKFHKPPRFWFERFGIWKKEIISLLDNVEKQVEALRRGKPDVIRANAFQLVNLASFIKERRITGIRPRIVFSMGSLLTPSARTLIETAFGCDVFDCYGATELGCIAWECSAHSGFHINIDAVVVEVVKNGRPAEPGETGKIIGTGLRSFALPFIRYDTGDVGVLAAESCPCGRTLPLLKKIEGRADDFFAAEDGTAVSPSIIVNQVKLVPGLGQFRIIQHDLKRVTAEITAGEKFTQDTAAGVKKTMTDIMGSSFEIEVTAVSNISADPSGKIRALISKVKKEF